MRHRNKDKSGSPAQGSRWKGISMDKKLYDLTVNDKFERLCPPLRDAEREVLEGSILANGCETPLIVWKGKGIIVDGHNRYRICKANGIPFAIEEKEFENEEEVMYWIVMNQIGRRNLNAYSKIEMVLPLMDILEQEAIKRMHSGKKAEEGASKESAQGKGRVTEHVGAMVGVSHNMVNQVMKIIRVADEETKAKLRCGDLSVNAVYQAIRREETKAEPDDDMAGGQDTSDTQTGDKPDTHTPRHTGGDTLSPLLDKPIITDPLQTAHIDGPIAFHPVVPDDDRDAGEPEYGEPSFEGGDNDAGEQVREMVDEFLEELGEVLETADAADAGHILEQVQRMTDTALAAIRDKMNEMEE